MTALPQTLPLALPITADPWGETRDFEALHDQATRVILRAVADLKAQAGPDGAGRVRPMPLVVLGTAGIGKTHLFSRLRRKLGRGATLVHIRPITSADMTPRYVLGQILQQLARPSGGIRQLDTLVGATLSLGWDGTPEQSAEGLELLRGLDEEGRKGNLEHFLARLLDAMPDLDDGYLEPLLKAPFLDTLALKATLAWLGGQDISETQARRIGARQALADDRVLPALRTLARLAASSVPLVVVFDQLENLIQVEGKGRILAYGNLIMDLVDEVKDLVIVQMALETEWERGFRPVLTLAQQARVSGTTLLLERPTVQEAEDLVRFWMADHPAPAGVFPWPFAAGDVRDLVERGATPRMLLQELQKRLGAEAALGAEPEPEPGGDLLARVWEEGLRAARAEIDERDRLEQGAVPEVLADGLIRLVGLLPELDLVRAQGPERLQIATPGGERRVAFIHQSDPRAIGSALERLGAAPGAKLGLRELWRPLKPTWKATRMKWEALNAAPEAAWYWLERADAERLQALDALLKSAVSRDLAGPGGVPFEAAQVAAWAVGNLEMQAWGIVHALRGAADGVLAAPEPGPEPAAESGLAVVRESGALRRLFQLRVASVDRLVRECRQPGQELTRRDVVAELKRAGPAVTWIGEHIVCLKG